MATYDLRIDWANNDSFTDTGDDVTSRVLGREPVSISYGRESQRSSSQVQPGQASFALNNISREYSPENGSSPLAGNILPARPVRIQATHLSNTYTLFRGHTDNFDVIPERLERAVKVTCLDLFAKFREATISTDLYFSITTGQAIGYILDAIGWPAADRDLDNGATTIRWWWEEGTDAFQALERVVNSEGLPALVTVDADGKFVFRDRHHRLTRTASKTSQATFRDAGAEPKFSAPLVYDQGWRDVINSVTLSVDERVPDGELSNVFETERIYSVSDGQTLPIRAESSDPFTGAVVPEEDTDYALRSGTITLTLSRTTGSSATIFVKAIGGSAIIDGMRLRAYPVRVASTFQVHAEDSTSIDRYGRRSYSQDAPWAGIHDAEAIAQIILAHRAERLPVVTFRVVNGNDTRLTQQLSRDLSDRVTIVDAETGLSDEFFIERIEHTISEAGRFHETVFGCEKVPSQPTDVFKLDVGQLDVNRLGVEGLSDPTTVLLLDDATQGKLDEALLGY
jgi:hypothetical protein